MGRENGLQSTYENLTSEYTAKIYLSLTDKLKGLPPIVPNPSLVSMSSFAQLPYNIHVQIFDTSDFQWWTSSNDLNQDWTIKMNLPFIPESVSLYKSKTAGER